MIAHRARPAMGTFLEIRVGAGGASVHDAIGEAFELASSFEARLTKFDPASELNKVAGGAPPAPDVSDLFSLAEQIQRVSRGAFRCYTGDRFDLSGLAKGWIVDRVCEFLGKRLPDSFGSVNAGGDLRFFNLTEKTVAVRIGGGLVRPIRTRLEAFATSSFHEADGNPRSTTRYPLPPARSVGREHTVSVEAPTCAIADALTKVGWFATAPVARACAERYGARILVFDAGGELIETFAAS